jgi:Uncharacterized Zn-finger containing protein
VSDFDEEAERERLREKYEQDSERRAETQQMSELLLKGATMTNAHCGTCGSPIFRYDGQEFCPTCQSRNAENEAADNGSMKQSDAKTAAASDNNNQPVNTGASPNAQTNNQSPAEANAQTNATATPDANNSNSGTPPTVEPVDTAVQTNTPDPTSQSQSQSQSQPQSQPTSDSDNTSPQNNASRPRRDNNGAVTDTDTAAHTNVSEQYPAENNPTRQTAVESLLEALTRHSQLAAASDDPRRARDHLQASNEAAEALNQLR